MRELLTDYQNRLLDNEDTNWLQAEHECIKNRIEENEKSWLDTTKLERALWQSSLAILEALSKSQKFNI